MNGIIITSNTPSRQPNHHSQCGCLAKPPPCHPHEYFLAKVSRFTRPKPTPRARPRHFQSTQHKAESHSRKKSLKKSSATKQPSPSPPRQTNPIEQYFPSQQFGSEQTRQSLPNLQPKHIPFPNFSPPRLTSIRVMEQPRTLRSLQEGLSPSPRVYPSSEPALYHKPKINFVQSSIPAQAASPTIKVQEPLSARVMVNQRQSLDTGKVYESMQNLGQLKEEKMQSSSSSDNNANPSVKPPQYDSLFFSQSQELKDSLFANADSSNLDSQKMLSTRSATHRGLNRPQKEGYLLSSNILKGKAKRVEQAHRNHLTNITDIEEICSQNDSSESNQAIKESIVLSRLNSERSQNKFFKNTLGIGKMTNANSIHTMPTMMASAFTRYDLLEERRESRETPI